MTVGDGEDFILQADVLHLDGETQPGEHLSSTQVIYSAPPRVTTQTPHPVGTADRPQSGCTRGGFN